MTPRIRSKQPCRIAPTTWDKVEPGDIVYCKVRGYYYTHLVKAINPARGCLIGNNHGGTNGWTKDIYGRVIDILPMGFREE
jgi:hypothetical protein